MQYNILYLAARPHFDVKDEWGSGIESCLERNLLEKSVFLKLVSKFYIENVTVSLLKKKFSWDLLLSDFDFFFFLFLVHYIGLHVNLHLIQFIPLQGNPQTKLFPVNPLRLPISPVGFSL